MESNNNGYQMRNMPIQQVRRDPNRIQNLQMMSNGNGYDMNQVGIPNSSQLNQGMPMNNPQMGMPNNSQLSQAMPMNNPQMGLNSQPYHAPGMIEPQSMPAGKRQIKSIEENNTNRRNMNVSQDTSMNGNFDSSLLYAGNTQGPVLTSGMQGGYNDTARGYQNLQNESSIDISQTGNFMKGRRAPMGKPIQTSNGPSVNFTPNMSGLQKLGMLPSIFVKQKFEMLEMLTGCETENRYKVYAADQGLEKTGRPIFKCKEKSGFFARNLLSGDCRPFGMRILHEDREEDDEADDMFLFLDRPCRFTVGCMNRPEITVTVKENGINQYIGKVVSEWACCDMLFTVYGANEEVVFKIYGNCCQWGLYCNCPCNSCAKIIFNIQSPTGDNIGEINKLYSGALQEYLTDTDNFCCIFPQNASPEQKALLLALVLFIDFRYFEQSPAQNNGLV